MSTENEQIEQIEQEDDAIMRAARALPRDVAPARDLWPGIESAIEEEQRPARWQRYAGYAAAVVLLVGGSSGVTWMAATGGDEAQPVAAIEPAPLEVQTVSASFGGDFVLGQEYLDTRQQLVTRLEARLAELSPEQRAEIERNMAEIRASIDQINTVLADEPDNALLRELLMTAYRDELQMMKRVDGLITTVMRRSDI